MLSQCPPQPPPGFNWEPSFIIAEAKRLIVATTQVWDRIAQIPLEHATFENAFLPILHDENSRMATARIISFFDSASPSKELRDASHQATEILSQDKLTCWGREDVFNVIDSVWKKQQQQQKHGALDAESHVVVERLRRNFIQAGMGLPDQGSRARLRSILEQRQILERQYTRNLDSDIGGQWLTVEELEGFQQHISTDGQLMETRDSSIENFPQSVLL
ncbi:Saccharolysin-like protein [Cladobotryum mycophilum]|uniref:Saccharolysin-like protein n=1 Tax=Cladobotryum mycophilum TaxID=491253 RepID=A0ABR0SRM4_9HYPO